MCNQVQSTKSYYYANMGRKEAIMEEYYSHSTMIDYGVFLNADSEEASMTKEDSRGEYHRSYGTTVDYGVIFNADGKGTN